MNMQQQIGPGKWKAPMWVWIAAAAGIYLWRQSQSGSGVWGGLLSGGSSQPSGTNRTGHGNVPNRRRNTGPVA